MQITKKVLRQLQKEPDRAFSVEEVFKKISGRGVSRADVVRALTVLENDGRVTHVREGGYRFADPMEAFIGRFAANRKGYGFVRLPDGDVFVPAAKTNGAIHGDSVRVRPGRRRGLGASREASVTEIIERANATLIGRFERRRDFGIVMPVNDRIFYEFKISSKDYASAQTGDIVEIEVATWPPGEEPPTGRVLRVIGPETTPGMDITMIVLAHNWPQEFNRPAAAAAEASPAAVSLEQLTNRRDLRGTYTVTIDGLDAKDFDDAVSLAVDERGHFKLGVHIADVSTYVTPNSALDIDAKARTTSMYLPDRVIPMLPHQLSNGICSLKPNVDRLALSVLMEIDPSGEVKNFNITPSVIQSDARLTYEEVDRRISGTDFSLSPRESGSMRDRLKSVPDRGRDRLKSVPDRIPDRVPDPRLERLIESLELLSKILEKKRLSRGSLSFETVEPKLVLDENGRPLEILLRERTTATQMIEETMILTNETVAEFMLRRGAPMVFRVHDRPDPDAVYGITRLMSELGYPMKSLENAEPRAFQALIDYAHTRPERLLVNSLLLRAMSRAKYSPALVPHFGLAAPHYSHFTSPIRRYPDLIAHRLIKAVLTKSLNAPDVVALIDELDEVCEHCSLQEREAEAASREAVNVKVAEFMSDKVGEVYQGVITGVSSFGFFVALENTAEGLVHVRTLRGDYFQFEAERHLLRGERTGQVFRLGQPVTVKLVSVSVAKRQLDFVVTQEAVT